jgi:hypothetical protein
MQISDKSARKGIKLQCILKCGKRERERERERERREVERGMQGLGGDTSGKETLCKMKVLEGTSLTKQRNVKCYASL